MFISYLNNAIFKTNDAIKIEKELKLYKEMHLFNESKTKEGNGSMEDEDNLFRYLFNVISILLKVKFLFASALVVFL